MNLNPGAGTVIDDGALTAFYARNGSNDYVSAKANIYNAQLFDGNERSLIENATGGAGDDTITGNNANNKLIGNDGNDHIFGGNGRDELLGGFGNDELRGEIGNDIMRGGAGDDIYYVDVGDTIVENVLERAPSSSWFNGWVNGGNDTVVTSLRSYTLGDNIENLYIGANPLGTGLSATKSTGTGNSLDNFMFGRRGQETLVGLDGNDTLDGYLNADVLIGGKGNDTYYVDNIGDVVDETYYVKGGGSGLLRFNSGYRDLGDAADTVVTNLASYDLSNAGSNNAAARAILPATLYGIIENLTYIGGAAFTGIGNDANNVITGGALSDALIGGRGHDTLRGQAGNDGLDLGEGDDKAYIDNGTAEGGDVVVGGGGYDSVFADDSTIMTGLRLNVFDAGTGYTPDVNRVAFTSAAIDVDYVEGNAGSDYIDASRLTRAIQIHGADGNDVIIGGAAGDILIGGNHSDTIIGGAGADAIHLGADNDDAYIDNGTLQGGDVVVGGGGFDSVFADGTTVANGLRLNLFSAGTGYTPDVNQVAFTSAAIDIDDVIGNDGNDWIDASRLTLGEIVSISGRSGNDTVISGNSSEHFEGGDDFDTIIYNDAASNYRFEFSEGFRRPLLKIVDLTSGTVDTVRNVELAVFRAGAYETKVNLSELVTTPVFTDGPDAVTLPITGGNFAALGGDDNLIYTGGLVAVDGGSGFDVLRPSPTSSEAPMRYIAIGAGVEAVVGGDGNDLLDASSATEYNLQIFAGEGDDRIVSGSGGAYTLQGGAGFDTVVFTGNADEYVINSTPSGWASWMTVTSVTTGAINWLQMVEQLQFNDRTVDAPGKVNTVQGTNAADIMAIGGIGQAVYGFAGDDLLTCGAGNDIIDGGAGADSLAAGMGDDVLFVDSADLLVDGGDGFDAVYCNDQANLEGLQWDMEGSNVEFVYGGLGRDIIDATGVTSTVTIWGQWGDDVITGGTGADYLLGDEWLPGGGSDVLKGGAGNDWLSGGNGNDTFIFEASDGADTIDDFGQSGDLDVLQFVGTEYSDLAELMQAGMVQQSGSNVVIGLSAEDQITLLNYSIASLREECFQFI